MLGGKDHVKCGGCGTVIKVRKEAPKPCPSCGHRTDTAALARDEEGVWRDPEEVKLARAMTQGLAEVAPFLAEHGFELDSREVGNSDGGHYATADLKRGDRTIHLWLRGGLSVHYRVAGRSLDHAAYMLALLGPTGGNRFPPYLHEPLEGFRALRYDLENFCADLLEGGGEEFLRCCAEAEQRRGESGFQRVERLDRELQDRPD